MRETLALSLLDSKKKKKKKVIKMSEEDDEEFMDMKHNDDEPMSYRDRKLLDAHTKFNAARKAYLHPVDWSLFEPEKLVESSVVAPLPEIPRSLSDLSTGSFSSLGSEDSVVPGTPPGFYSPSPALRRYDSLRLRLSPDDLDEGVPALRRGDSMGSLRLSLSPDVYEAPVLFRTNTSPRTLQKARKTNQDEYLPEDEDEVDGSRTPEDSEDEGGSAEDVEDADYEEADKAERMMQDEIDEMYEKYLAEYEKSPKGKDDEQFFIDGLQDDIIQFFKDSGMIMDRKELRKIAVDVMEEMDYDSKAIDQWVDEIIDESLGEVTNKTKDARVAIDRALFSRNLTDDVAPIIPEMAFKTRPRY